MIDPIVSLYSEDKAFWVYSKRAANFLEEDNRLIDPVYGNPAGVSMNKTLLSKFFTEDEVMERNVQ